jgi:hypothetical protein
MHKSPLGKKKNSWLWLLVEVCHNLFHFHLEKSPHLCSPFELNATCSSEKLGDADLSEVVSF